MKLSYITNFIIFVVVTIVVSKLLPNNRVILGLALGAIIFMGSEYFIGKTKLMQKMIPRYIAVGGIIFTTFLFYLIIEHFVLK